MKIEVYKMRRRPGKPARICWRAVAANGKTLARGCGGKEQGFSSMRTLMKNVRAMGLEDSIGFNTPVFSVALSDKNMSMKEVTRRLERAMIKRALERTGGNRTHSARMLGISHRALLYKIRDYGFDEQAIQ